MCGPIWWYGRWEGSLPQVGPPPAQNKQIMFGLTPSHNIVPHMID